MGESGEGDLFLGLQKIHGGGEGFNPSDGPVVDGRDGVLHLKPGFLQEPLFIFESSSLYIWIVVESVRCSRGKGTEEFSPPGFCPGLP